MRSKEMGTAGDALLLSVPEVAERLGVCARTLWSLIHVGRLRSVRIGGRRLTRRRDLTDFVEALGDERRH